MKLSSRIKPISYIKANAADVLRGLADHVEPLIITHNGEAKAVLQDINAYEQTQETLALLTLLALGKREIAAGETKEASAVFAELAIE
ncbi:MAG: type II toxin-antitoxin system Phd/YefM family antitoxin [Trueperaceae bacterium]